MSKTEPRNLAIGKLAERTGLSVSAIRFYETRGLITPHRNTGGQRRFARSDIRRLSFIMITQQLEFSLEEISDMLAGLPNKRTPTQRDWTGISSTLTSRLDERIAHLTQLRTRLSGCIGCGCLSLAKCKLYNSEDRAAANGPGPRYVMGDRASDL